MHPTFVQTCRRMLGVAWLLIATPSLVTAAETVAARTKITVAAASSLQPLLDPLQTRFAAAHRELELVFITAATGSLVAQIRHGAPYDVLLAADLDYPRTLVASGEADADALFTFALGQLVLIPRPPAASEDWTTRLRDPAVRRIAIGNPDIAPYGRAAREVLRRAGLWDELTPKIVIGDNIAQALQFVSRGHAEYGFVALSQLRLLDGDGPLNPSAYWAFPDTLPQGALLLKRAKQPMAAGVFLSWLQDDDARAVLHQFGYRDPADVADR
ncbi:molybdate ABC transporter substrate-binding protein [Synoicihabitans lomoniglobus]|uniref:Molybdate ABC transporter substrate-binding protein n=1 Tax=Synoicihabitans lomoniglobus TaxID=2909285 RepID=A0AAF0CPI9_9BACT|nr:molybdate ABC transporter substrate-binding protein [Opitutaceae bacterium LMO-M01]WED64984.1 molybdate ABC transporter substrate-binding protein [Opitutaceae bacterium LMO-M01]